MNSTFKEDMIEYILEYKKLGDYELFLDSSDQTYLSFLSKNDLNVEDELLSDDVFMAELYSKERVHSLLKEIAELRAQVKKNAKREHYRFKRFCLAVYEMMVNSEDIKPFLHPRRPSKFDITGIVITIIDIILKSEHNPESITAEENELIMYELGSDTLRAFISEGFELFDYTPFKLKADHQKELAKRDN